MQQDCEHRCQRLEERGSVPMAQLSETLRRLRADVHRLGPPAEDLARWTRTVERQLESGGSGEMLPPVLEPLGEFGSRGPLALPGSILRVLDGVGR